MTSRNRVPDGSVSRRRMFDASWVPRLFTRIVYVSVPLVAIGSIASDLLTVRSMPVTTVVDCEEMLFVSSASKMVLFGSTVATFVIVPMPAGASSVAVRVTVDSGPTSPVQVRTFVAGSTAHDQPNGVVVPSRSVPAGSGSRINTPLAVFTPLLPMTKV